MERGLMSHFYYVNEGRLPRLVFTIAVGRRARFPVRCRSGICPFRQIRSEEQEAVYVCRTAAVRVRVRTDF